VAERKTRRKDRETDMEEEDERTMRGRQRWMVVVTFLRQGFSLLSSKD
jgi:hypothetical protein